MNGSALRGLQQRFQAHIDRPSADMERLVAATERIGARERLDVYVEAYRLRLLEVLADDYPALKRHAGDDRFDQLGRAYIEAHPSRHFNARWYGDALAGFLKASPPWAEEPALSEMAALEWAMTLVFDAADEPAATAAALADLPSEAWGKMRPEPVRALHRLTLHWNVAAIRTAFDRKTDLPPARRLAPPEDWVVWRRDLTVHYRRLEPDETETLELFRYGGSFGAMCEALSARLPPRQIPARAAALLKRWLDDGLIRDVRPT